MKMRGSLKQGILAGSQKKHRKKGDQRKCQCPECLHNVATRASEKREWTKESELPELEQPEGPPKGPYTPQFDFSGGVKDGR